MIFKIRNIVIILIPLFFLVGCNVIKDVTSSIKYEKAGIECLFAINKPISFSDTQRCMVKRLSSLELCSNFKNLKNKKVQQRILPNFFGCSRET